MKRLVSKFIPPILLELRRKILGSQQGNDDRLYWSGDYPSWGEAQANSSGYDADNIFKKTAEAILKVKRGEAVYERDAVLFDTPQYSWPLIAILLKIVTQKKNSLKVLDFGGSLGSSYFQNREFFRSVMPFKWGVVEQDHYIDFGNEKLADEHLRFYFTIEDCLREQMPDVLLLSGVIQCLDEPYVWLEKFTSKKIEHIIFDRTAFIDDARDRLTVQHVPESIYKASYPAWFFSKQNFFNAMKKHYDLVAGFDNGITADIRLDGTRAYWTGMHFKLRS